MNAEVALALRPLLDQKARENGVCVTSDAGDQHGVLAVMIEEAEEMGFDIVQAGNIKGFLDQSATPESIKPEADKRNLSAEQCCAYTDGSKLHIEMALLANAYGYLPPQGGMVGPRAEQVHEALDLFDFESYGETPRIDYLLGAEPGGGVYLVVKPQEGLPEQQAFYLNYYKLGDGPYYLLYRPYHLCHLETPKAIKRAFDHEPLLCFGQKTCEVYAYAKRPLKRGETISHAIGSAEVFGEVEPVQANLVPMVLMENQAVLTNDLKPNDPVTWDDVELSDTPLFRYWKEQEYGAITAQKQGISVRVYEKESRVGGLASGHNFGGNWYDLGVHMLHAFDEECLKIVRMPWARSESKSRSRRISNG